MHRIHYGVALASVLVSLAAAQVEQAWSDSFNTAFVTIDEPVILTVDTGGVVTGWEVTEFQEPAEGVAVIQRLTENGDLAWEVTHPLEGQKFFGLYYHQFLGGLGVSPDGAVAYAIVSNDSLELTMLNADGTQRWSTSVSPVVGPNYDKVNIEVAPNGDLVAIANEGLWAGYPSVRSDVWRLDAASGAILWTVSKTAEDFARVAVDALGNTYIMVRSDGSGSTRVTRYDSAGVSTGFARLVGSFASEVLSCDDRGRCATITRSSGGTRVTSINASLEVEWTQDFFNEIDYNVAQMADGHVIVYRRNESFALRRYDRQGNLVGSPPPPSPDPYRYRQVVAKPNGNSVSIAQINTASVGFYCRTIVEEHDPAGALVHSYELPVTPSMCPRGHGVAVDKRANVYGIYTKFMSGFNPFCATSKLLISEDLGVQYCSPAAANSTGRYAKVRALGSTSVMDNNLSLLFQDLPPGSTLLPVGSRMTGFVPMAGGSQGTLCLGGGVGRFDEPGEIRMATSEGLTSVQLELTQFPTPGGLISAMAGEVWNFQAWYRDANPTLTSNFTDAVAVTLR